MKKTAVIILAEGFEEIEAVTPADILIRSGVHVILAGLKDREVKGSRGITLKADCLVSDMPVNFDALILPGGKKGADNLSSSQIVHDLIITQFKRGGIIAAICASPAVILKQTGILAGKKVTSYPEFKNDFESNTEYQDKNVVVDGNLVTSKGPGTAFEFSLKLSELLCGEHTATQVAKAAVYSY